jgi:uncharacterized membrane protein YciS (DUF1049 family)
MPDLVQVGFTIGVLIAAVGAFMSVVMTYRVSVSLRQLEKKLQTKDGLVPGSLNEEDVLAPTEGRNERDGEADE